MKNYCFHCETCKNDFEYNERYDAYFCRTCDEWTEKKCDDDKCWYCVGRGEKPSNLNRYHLDS
jgi:hypothetical protein